MADTPVFRSSVVDASLQSGSLKLTDESSLAKMSVRAAADTATAAAMAVGFGTARRGNGVLVAGIRPDEWWVLGEDHAVRRELSPTDMPGFAHVVDVTHGRVCLRLTGVDAARALEKVCSLDFSDDMTPDLAAVSASVAKVSCDLIRVDQIGERSYLVLADRSFGQYLFAALADAAAEF